MTKPVKLHLQEVPPSDANHIVLNLVIAGILPSIGKLGMMTPTGFMELAIVENQGADPIQIVNIDGRIGTPYMVEVEHDIASPVRISMPDGSIKAWARKTD